MKKNKFRKALKHLKSKKIDEKIKSLEEAAPTNNMSGVYQVTPSTGDAFRMGKLDPARTFYPKADGTWPAGIPANAGDRVYVKGAGYHTGKGAVAPTQTITPRDFSIAHMNANGNDTTTMIRASDGMVYSDLPEGTRNFILGPLVTSYTQNHIPFTDDDFTNIGYLQKDTRQFVLLARIQGYFDGSRRASGRGRTWDGTSNQFTSFNSNFTLEHALWMLDAYNTGNFTENVPFNLSGGIPADRHPDDPGLGGGDAFGTDGANEGGDGDDDGQNQDPPDGNPGFPPEAMGYPWGMDPDDLPDPFDMAEMSDEDLGELDPPFTRDPNGDIRPMTEDEKNEHDAEVLGLSPDEWAKIAEVFDASLLALDLVAVLGVIFPEFTTSAAGAFQLARRANQVRRAWQIWSNRNKGGPSPKPKTPKPDVSPNPKGDVPNSDRRGKNFNVDKDTGIVRDDNGTPTFEPTFDTDGNQTGYKPVDPRNIDRGRSDPSSGGDNPNTGHPEYNPGGKYNVKPPIGGGGGGPKPSRGGGRPPRGGGGQPKFTGFDGKPLKPVDPSTIRRPDGKPFDPLPPMGGGSGKNTGKPPKGSFREWWNRGRNERIKNENDASFGNPLDQFARDPDKADPNTLFGDDRQQRGQGNQAFDTGKKSSPIGRPDRAVLGRDLNPLSPDFGKKVAPERGGPGSGPTPLIRQTVERPIRGLKGAGKKAGASDNLLGKQLTQQQEKDVIRKTRVLEDRLVNNLKNKGEIDQFISKTEKAGEFIQRNEKASNVLDTAIKGAQTAREVGDQIGQYLNTMKIAGTAYGKFLLHNAGVMKATDNNPVRINLPKQDAQNVSNTINKYLRDNKVPVEQWGNLPQKHLDGINSLVATGQQTNRSTINNKFRGEGGILRDEYHNTVNNIGRKDAFARHIKTDSKGQPYVSGIDDNYTFTDPQDALGGITAKLVEITNKSPFTRNRKDSGYKYKNADGTEVPTGNMPSRWNLPAPSDADIKKIKVGQGGRELGSTTRRGGVVKNSYEPKGINLSEDKLKILKEIKQPLREIQELPKTTKLKGYRPNFKGRFSPQNTPDVTASKQSDDIVSGKNSSRQVWTAKDKFWKGYETTERMNIIYDNLGFGSQYFDRIVDENVRLKSKKSREVQEHLNMLAHQKAMREVYGIKEYENFIDESETFDNKINDPLFTKVAKRLKKEIDYPKKPAAKGYPDKAPPKIDPNTGMHPKFGKRYKYDKLDPISAKTMAGAPTGDPEIDANVKRQAQKEDWRSDLKNLWLGSERKDWKKKIEEDFVNTTQGMKVGQTFVDGGLTVTTSGGLGGVESTPKTVTIDLGFGDTVTVDAPSYNQYGLQGFAKPIDIMRRGKKKTEELNNELDSSEEYTKEIKADEFMKARVDNEKKPDFVFGRDNPTMPGVMKDPEEIKMNKMLYQYYEIRQKTIDRNDRESSEFTKKTINPYADELLRSLKLKTVGGLSAREMLYKNRQLSNENGTIIVTIDSLSSKNKIKFIKSTLTNGRWSSTEKSFNLPRLRPLPVMPEFLQKWEAQAIDPSFAIQRKEGAKLAKAGKVESAFNLVNYYIDKHVKTGAGYDPSRKDIRHDVTDLYSNETIDILRKGMNELKPKIDEKIKLGKKVNQSKESLQKEIRDLVDNYFAHGGAGKSSRDIFNSLGNALGFNLDTYMETGNYQFDSTYLFTSTYDMGIRGKLGFLSGASRKYVAGQLDGETGMAVQNPMQFQVNVESGLKKETEGTFDKDGNYIPPGYEDAIGTDEIKNLGRPPVYGKVTNGVYDLSNTYSSGASEAEVKAGYEKARKGIPSLPPFSEISSDFELPDIPKEGWTYQQYMEMYSNIQKAAADREYPIVTEILRYGAGGDKTGQVPLSLVDAQEAIVIAVTKALDALTKKWEAYNKIPEPSGYGTDPRGGQGGRRLGSTTQRQGGAINPSSIGFDRKETPFRNKKKNVRGSGARGGRKGRVNESNTLSKIKKISKKKNS